MKSKKVIAFALAAVLALGGTVTAFADDLTGITGTGTNTGALNEDVYTAIVPGAEAAEMYNFVADPERLIARSGEIISGSGENATGAAVGAQSPKAAVNGIYFKQSDGNYSNVSSGATIELHNYNDFTVGIDVEVTDAGDIPLTGTVDLINDSGSDYKTDAVTGAAAEMYLGVRVVTGTALTSSVSSAAITTAGVTNTITCPGVEGNYKVVVTNSAAGAKYVLQEGKAGDTGFDANNWNKITFDIHGAVTYAKIDDSVVKAPSIKLTWDIKPVGGVAAVEGTASLLPYKNVYYLGLKGKDDASFANAATSVKVNGVDVTDKATLIGGYIAVSASDLTAAGINTSSKLNAVYVVDKVTYKASYGS